MRTVNLNVVYINIITTTGSEALGWNQNTLSQLISQTNRVWRQANIMTPGIIRANPVLTGLQISTATTSANRRQTATSRTR
jgi:hypothetical protein